MKYLLQKILNSCIALVLALGPVGVFAEADGPDFYQVTKVAKGDVLNIRSAPNGHAQKVGEIPPDGTCLRNLGCQGGLSFKEYSSLSAPQRKLRLKQNPRWCKVEYHGITGWALGTFLAESGLPCP